MKDFGHLISKFSVIGIPLLNTPHRDMQKNETPTYVMVNFGNVTFENSTLQAI